MCLGCPGNTSIFGNTSQFIKFQGGDIVAIEGVNTIERLIAGDIRIPYKQLLKSRVILKPGQANYLLNHLGLGDNATFLAIKATYNVKSVNEEDNYIDYYYYNDLSTRFSFNQIIVLTGNSQNRIQQLYLTNPNEKYSVTLDVMVAVIDETYSFFSDTLNQSGTSFTGLTWDDIESYVIGESIVVKDDDDNPLIYLNLSNINSISRTSHVISVDDDALGTILLVFTNIENAAQAYSLLSYVLGNSNIDISNLIEDTDPPVIYWLSNVGGTGDYIQFNGSTSSVPYDTSNGFTFSTTISLTDFGPTISSSNLISLLVDYIEDDRDGLIIATSSNILIKNYADDTITSITASGTYSVSFVLSDLALNNLDDVIMTLSIDN